jgi:hypothetical protein
MSPAALSRRALLLGLLATSSVLAKPTSRFTFKIPQGWTDMLADGLPDEVVTNLHPSLAAQLLVQDHLAFAADLNPGHHGQNSFLQALALPGKVEINESTLPELRKQIEKNHQEREVQATIKSATIVAVGDADAARVLWEVKNDEGDEVRLAYLFSGGEEPGVMLLFGANAKDFERVRPLMEEAALATRGAVPTPKFEKYFYKSLPILQIIGAVGLIALLLTGRKKQQLVRPAAPAKAENEHEDGDAPAPPPASP